MAKRHKIAQGLREAISYADGARDRGKAFRFKVPENVDVRAIRESLELSQPEFALRFGFSLGTLRHWEQGLRRPEGPARVLLTLVASNPRLVVEALDRAMKNMDKKVVAVS
jgi:putative transcriptional regulator